MISGDVDNVGEEVLAGVEAALSTMRKRYRSNMDPVRFSAEVNLVVRFIELLCVAQLKTLDLETIPRILRTDLLINLSR